jgi:CRISPR-associated protein Cas2
MYMVIAYDVVCDRRRNRLSKLLLAYGERVNFSVFEIEIREQQFNKLQTQVLELIDPDEDHVRFYELCLNCRRRIQACGRAPVHREEDVQFV